MFVLLYQRLMAWCAWEFQKSTLITWFLTKNENPAVWRNSIFTRLFYGIRNLLAAFFRVTGLRKLFVGSIFKMPYIWCFFAAALAPFLPTMLVLALTAAGFGSLLLLAFCNRRKKFRSFPIDKYIYLLAGAYFFATITSVAGKGSLFGGLLSIFFMLFYFVVIQAIETRRQLQLVLFCFILAGVLVSFYGFYQFLNPGKYSGVWHDKDMFEAISFRVYATFGNPNVLGEYFLLVIPVTLAYVINSRTLFNRLFFLGAAGIMLICLVLTYSRGCYIGILAAVFVFLVLLDRRFLLLGLLGLLLLPFILPETILNRFLSIGDMQDSSTSYRVYIWMGTIAMLKDYWVCGIGPGESAFNMVYPAYAYNGISAPHAHNLFLQMMSDGGICAVLLFLLVLFQFYKTMCGSLREEKSRRNRVFIISGIATVSGFLVQSMTDYTFYNYRVMLLFWISIGFAMLFTNLSHMREEEAI